MLEPLKTQVINLRIDKCDVEKVLQLEAKIDTKVPSNDTFSRMQTITKEKLILLDREISGISSSYKEFRVSSKNRCDQMEFKISNNIE